MINARRSIHNDESELDDDQNDSQSLTQESSITKGHYNIRKWLIIIISVAIVILAVVKFETSKVVLLGTEAEVQPGHKKCSFEKLQKNHPLQGQKVWRTLTVGIEHIINKNVKKPAVYLFAHQGNESTQHLIREIASYASSCFVEGSVVPLEMEIDDFYSVDDDDYGFAIKKFKEKIKRGKVIVIANLNKIPAKVARSLHTICDIESPIAPDVVIFLTLIVPHVQGNIEIITENALQDLWKEDMADNELWPLIARVTDQVIALKS